MGRFIKPIAIIALALAGAAGATALWGYRQYVGPGPLAEETAIVIARGAGIDEIAGTLHAAGVLGGATVFRLAARLAARETPLKAGEFAFPAAVSAKAAIELMQSGKTVVRRVTAAEGLTTAEILALLDTTPGLTGSVRPEPPEGSLLPETYHFSYGDRRLDVVRRMQDAMRALLDSLWRQRDETLPLKSPAEALILASLVEKETGKPEERPRIAAVFLNRLRRGMRLQSDPTVVYGLTGGAGPLGRPLSRADLRIPTPYNTYLIGGLPPSPIANPGSAALESVMRPAKSDDLYFVADGSGGHVFAVTLKQHNRNVAKWRKLKKRPSGEGR